MRFDLHIHSEYSYDSFNKLNDIFKIAKQQGLSGIAITDHGTFKGSLEASKQANRWGIMVIPGMEIATEIGDVVGLFIKDEITTTKFNDVVSEIKSQNGLVVLPHPFKRAKNISNKILDKIDLIEVFNARGESLGVNYCNQRAYELAMENSIPMSAGSDAHFLTEIGRGCIDIPSVYSLEELKKKLIDVAVKDIVMHPTSGYMEVFSQFIKSYKTKDIDVLLLSCKRLIRTLQWDIYMKIKKIVGKHYGQF